MEGQTATQVSLQSEMVPKEKSGHVEEIDVEMQPSEQDPDPLNTNMEQQTATEDSSQNKMASTNETHPGEEAKTVSVEMQSIEKESNKKITKNKEDNRGGVFEVTAVANNVLQEETEEVERRESVIPSALTAKNQLRLLHHKIYLLNFMLVIVFLIAAVSLVLAVVALTETQSSLGESTSAPGEKAEKRKFNERYEDSNAVRQNITKQSRYLEHIQKELTVQKENLKRLANHTSVLQERMDRNYSQGPQGPAGEQGPAGVCNMTQCRHQQINVTHLGNSSVVILHENKHKGWKIVGATCSTDGAAEYVFKQAFNSSDNTNEYSCQCKGLSRLFVTSNNTTSCVIHFWKCPTNSTNSLILG